MRKKLLSIKLSETTLAIVTKYQEDHGKCDRTKAISDMIDAYPLLKVKSEHSDQAKRIKENMPKESIMPDVCMHIDDLDLNRDAVHCVKRKAWVKLNRCQRCNDRTTENGSLENHG